MARARWCVCAIPAVFTLMSNVSVAAADGVERFQLENGVRVVVHHVADSPQQATFTFLPHGLATDDAHRAQWTHLLEHMMVRSTDAVGLGDPDLTFNGETSFAYTHLETICAPERLAESLGKHAAWLSTRSITPDVLEREKGNIAGEEAAVTRSGFDVKFAVAAWNQITSHGLEHARVHGDVSDADVDGLIGYARNVLPVDERVTIATIGPVDPEAVRRQLEETVGRIPQLHAPHRLVADPATINSTATWDMEGRHLFLWRRLPERTPATQAAAHVLALVLQAKLFLDTDLKPLIRTPAVIPGIAAGDGACFLIQIGLQPEADANRVRELTRGIIEQILDPDPRVGPAGFWGPQVAMQYASKANFAQLRGMTPEPQRHLVEGNWLLGRSALEYSWGLPLEEIAGHLRAVDQEAIDTLRELLLGEETGVLVLEPATEGEVGPGDEPGKQPDT